MQFSEMSSVSSFVDQSSIKETQDWLISRKDNKGGFKQDPQALDSFGRAPANITNAYIIWALVSSGYTDIEDELKSLIQIADTSILSGKVDPYYLGLLSSTLYILKKKDTA